MKMYRIPSRAIKIKKSLRRLSKLSKFEDNSIFDIIEQLEGKFKKTKILDDRKFIKNNKDILEALADIEYLYRIKDSFGYTIFKSEARGYAKKTLTEKFVNALATKSTGRNRQNEHFKFKIYAEKILDEFKVTILFTEKSVADNLNKRALQFTVTPHLESVTQDYILNKITTYLDDYYDISRATTNIKRCNGSSVYETLVHPITYILGMMKTKTSMTLDNIQLYLAIYDDEILCIDHSNSFIQTKELVDVLRVNNEENMSFSEILGEPITSFYLDTKHNELEIPYDNFILDKAFTVKKSKKSKILYVGKEQYATISSDNSIKLLKYGVEIQISKSDELYSIILSSNCGRREVFTINSINDLPLFFSDENTQALVSKIVTLI